MQRRVRRRGLGGKRHQQGKEEGGAAHCGNLAGTIPQRHGHSAALGPIQQAPPDAPPAGHRPRTDDAGSRCCSSPRCRRSEVRWNRACGRARRRPARAGGWSSCRPSRSRDGRRESQPRRIRLIPEGLRPGAELQPVLEAAGGNARQRAHDGAVTGLWVRAGRAGRAPRRRRRGRAAASADRPGRDVTDPSDAPSSRSR